MPSKSQYQDPNYIPVDLIEYLNEEEEEEERREQYRLDEPRRREEQIEAAGYDQYLYFRNTHGLSHARAALAADYHPETITRKFIDTMPAAKKTSKSGTKVSKPSYPKKTVKTTTTKAVDINKLVKAATERALSKNIETQHSYARIIMEGALSYTNSGLNMSSLNLSSKLGFTQNQLLAFNLSSMIQVRGSTTSGAAYGWRQGNKVNLESITVDVRGSVYNPNVDCKYHVWVCRKKDGVTVQYHNPGLVGLGDPGLWKTKTSGPFAVNDFSNFFPTTDRKNTESWSWPEGMHDSKGIVQVPDANGVRTLNMGFYKKIGHVWEFNTDGPTASPALKDGDYVLFVFREGEEEQAPPHDTITVNIDIAFKDT
jgi:hypothetical protein